MINWKVRFRNKTWLVSFLAVILAFVYQVLGMFDIVPAVTQDMAAQLIMAVVNILAAVGVVVDPTTAGASDSKQAMEYEVPKED
nr:MAG TPA: holin [Caudoviricetes sp.]